MKIAESPCPEAVGKVENVLMALLPEGRALVALMRCPVCGVRYFTETQALRTPVVEALLFSFQESVLNDEQQSELWQATFEDEEE